MSSIAGIRKPSVLPEPVRAAARMSLPSRRGGPLQGQKGEGDGLRHASEEERDAMSHEGGEAEGVLREDSSSAGGSAVVAPRGSSWEELLLCSSSL